MALSLDAPLPQVSSWTSHRSNTFQSHADLIALVLSQKNAADGFHLLRSTKAPAEAHQTGIILFCFEMKRLMALGVTPGSKRKGHFI